MRYAKKAITLVIGLTMIGGSISAAAAGTSWHYGHSYGHSYRHDSDRGGYHDRGSERGRGAHHEDRGNGHEGHWR